MSLYRRMLRIPRTKYVSKERYGLRKMGTKMTHILRIRKTCLRQEIMKESLKNLAFKGHIEKKKRKTSCILSNEFIYIYG